LHGAQIRYTGGKLTFVGSDACKTCHFKEHEIWAKSKHGEALKFLEDPKYSNRPTGRQYDPECVICHTVGFSFQSGYEAKDKTPKLQHVGCEVCHGPGSGHAANPANKELLTYLSPWKTKPGDLLPGKDVLEAIGKADKFKDDRGQLIGKLTVDQRIVINAVVNQCVKCHDPENDPKFDLYEYMPKIWHSGFKTNPGAGLPMGIGK
jgi:hypothetical protein